MLKNPPLNLLSPRETQIYKLLIAGFTTSQISNNLNLKSNTVSTVKKNIYFKFKVNTMVDLIKVSFLYGYIDYATFIYDATAIFGSIKKSK